MLESSIGRFFRQHDDINAGDPCCLLFSSMTRAMGIISGLSNAMLTHETQWGSVLQQEHYVPSKSLCGVSQVECPVSRVPQAHHQPVHHTCPARAACFCQQSTKVWQICSQGRSFPLGNIFVISSNPSVFIEASRWSFWLHLTDIPMFVWLFKIFVWLLVCYKRITSELTNAKKPL